MDGWIRKGKWEWFPSYSWHQKESKRKNNEKKWRPKPNQIEDYKLPSKKELNFSAPMRGIHFQQVRFQLMIDMNHMIGLWSEKIQTKRVKTSPSVVNPFMWLYFVTCPSFSALSLGISITFVNHKCGIDESHYMWLRTNINESTPNGNIGKDSMIRKAIVRILFYIDNDNKSCVIT